MLICFSVFWTSRLTSPRAWFGGNISAYANVSSSRADGGLKHVTALVFVVFYNTLKIAKRPRPYASTRYGRFIIFHYALRARQTSVSTCLVWGNISYGLTSVSSYIGFGSLFLISSLPSLFNVSVKRPTSRAKV